MPYEIYFEIVYHSNPLKLWLAGFLMNALKEDSEIYKNVLLELERQKTVLNMIPSENYVSEAVLEVCGSVLMNKYSEGYPTKRYYQGNEFVDNIELIAIERAKKLFGVEHVNVQPYSGSPANQAVYVAVCQPGDVVMGHCLPDGGHLTHGWKVNFSGMHYKSVQYHVKKDGYLDLEEVRKLALENKPKLIWCGATAYSREIPFEEFGKIADEVGAYFAADIAHIAGLVATGVHKSPVPFAHIITTTTHKTLRGPRGGMIMVTKKGLEKDSELAKKIDRAVFPGLQGGPHDNVIAGKAVAFGEAMKPEFKIYCRQIVRNSRALADSLMAEGIKLVSDGTDNHLILVDLLPFGIGLGKEVAVALEKAGICCNANSIPEDPSTPFKPSGIRLGTPILTTRGMREVEMREIGKWIASVVKDFGNERLLGEIRGNVLGLCGKFPVYANLGK
jgi:glycine hydroxymethyltransferase